MPVGLCSVQNRERGVRAGCRGRCVFSVLVVCRDEMASLSCISPGYAKPHRRVGFRPFFHGGSCRRSRGDGILSERFDTGSASCALQCIARTGPCRPGVDQDRIPLFLAVRRCGAGCVGPVAKNPRTAHRAAGRRVPHCSLPSTGGWMVRNFVLRGFLGGRHWCWPVARYTTRCETTNLPPVSGTTHPTSSIFGIPKRSYERYEERRRVPANGLPSVTRLDYRRRMQESEMLRAPSQDLDADGLAGLFVHARACPASLWSHWPLVVAGVERDSVQLCLQERQGGLGGLVPRAQDGR